MHTLAYDYLTLTYRIKLSTPLNDKAFLRIRYAPKAPPAMIANLQNGCCSNPPKKAAKTGAAIDVDISILVSIIGTYYFNFSYLVNVKKIAVTLKDLSDFKTFGIPPGMAEFNKKLNKISKWHQVIISLTFSGFLETQACEAKNIEKGIKDVCGLAIKIWVPFDIDYFPVKQVIFLIQTYSGYFSYATSSTISFISFSVMESMQHVVFRLTHVKMVFVEALKTFFKLTFSTLFFHKFESYIFSCRFQFLENW
ncbi:hypothetical protein NQ318_018470 [Aromia moschata]|uniref:Uncharacterized protein n=1 Tax=Aromia moschata TaxID=1265417 RepID=A0AAV8YLS6_9CUCU|nr:hypothetical protein NQ318_018470 [Aromia moschata]